MSYEEQNLHLNGLLQRHESKNPVDTLEPHVTLSGQSVFSFVYFLRNSSKVDIKVCQKAFCDVFGFGSKPLQVLRQKMKEGISSVEPDKRGKHGNQPRVNEDILCHYSRADNNGRTYLSPHLSVVRLYWNFLEIHDPEYIELEQENLRRKMSHEPALKLRKPIVSQHFNHDLFVSEFNIHFGYPRTDTCCKD